MYFILENVCIGVVFMVTNILCGHCDKLVSDTFVWSERFVTCTFSLKAYKVTLNEPKRLKSSDLVSPKRLKSACDPGIVLRMNKLCILGYPKLRSVKILIRLRECSVWSECSLGAHVRRYFSDVAIQMFNKSLLGGNHFNVVYWPRQH